MTPPPLPTSSSIASRLRDFPNWFSPMLVKELRQGLKNHQFSVVFILFQLTMVTCMAFHIIASQVGDVGSSLFWWPIVLFLLIVQPLRGTTTLAAEYTLKTMDLIQLTQLNAWRITLGKWTALNAQSLLFLIGVLPYMAMRYLVVGTNLVDDLVQLLYCGLGSAFISALAVASSAIYTPLMRILLLLLLIIGIPMFLPLLLFWSYGGTSLSLGSIRHDVFALSLVAILYGGYFFLSFAACRIAPRSENHATSKRLVALGTALLSFFIGGQYGSMLALLILALSSIDALTEPMSIYSRILAPFRRHAYTRPLGCLLAPGWFTGIFYFFLCTTLVSWILTSQHPNLLTDHSVLNVITYYLTLCNFFLFPLLFLHLIFPRHASSAYTFGLYCLLQAFFIFFSSMTFSWLEIAHSVTAPPSLKSWIEKFPLPTIFLMGFADRPADTDQGRLYYFFASLVTLLLCLMVPLGRQKIAIKDFFHHLRSR